MANALFNPMRLSVIPQNWQRSIKRLLPVLFLVSFLTVLLADNFIPTQTGGGSTQAIAQESRPEIRGVWMTLNDKNVLRDKRKVKDAVTQLKRLNFNTIYPVVWNSGYVMYESPIAKRAGIQPFVYRGNEGQDFIADLINQAHSQDLLVIPWFEFGFMAPPTSELALNHPDWLTEKRDGSQTSISAAGEVAWLNPFHPEVQQFITDLVLEVVTKYDADGIQFDDHMSLPYEFGYDKYTASLYRQETGNNPPNNPQDQEWMGWRADRITAFMVQLNEAVKARKPQAIFSVSPNYYDFAYKLHLQDWLTWVRMNIVDELIVQVYRPELQSFIAKISRPEMREVQQTIPTGVGIMAGLRNNPVPMQRIKSQVQAAQERGLGVIFFYYESLWDYAPESAQQRQSGFASLFPDSAVRTASQPTPLPPPESEIQPPQPINSFEFGPPLTTQ
ncbi:MAG: glycoside hydrolase family 10 protein [Nostocaceae cyanobacterium]|nr:glycoside hydrolase family 10 protein [Nostocaceae cyanobacterium]